MNKYDRILNTKIYDIENNIKCNLRKDNVKIMVFKNKEAKCFINNEEYKVKAHYEIDSGSMYFLKFTLIDKNNNIILKKVIYFML